MKFSVIIPCYNAGQTIKRALDSLKNQSYCDWEAICIDDCSKDNTVEIISDYIERENTCRVSLIRNEINSGPGVSRNRGITMAEGEYLCFLDADDYFADNTFQILEKSICETNADIVFFGCNQVIGRTIRKKPRKARNNIPDYIALVSGSLCLATWKKELWTDIEMPPINNAEDIAVIPILISRANVVETINSLLYYYVHRNCSTSSLHHPQVSHNFVNSYRYTLKHIEVDKFKESVEFHGIKTIIYGATLNAIKAGMANKEIKGLWLDFEKKFPDWSKNKYLKSYAKSKRVFVWLASHHFFLAMRFYAEIHKGLLRYFG